MQNEVLDVELSHAALREMAETKPEKMDRKATAALTKDVRLAAGLSIEGLARILGVAPEDVAQWESGEKIPDGPELAVLRLARIEPQTLASRAQAEIKSIVEA